MLASDFMRINTKCNEVNTAPIKLVVNDFLIGNPGIQGSNIFIRLSCFLEAGCFDENLKSCTDRDICIRLAELGYLRYKRIPIPLVNHYADENRTRLSSPNSEEKKFGLLNFWNKYSKRMTECQKKDFIKRAKKLFNWDLATFQRNENNNNIESYQMNDNEKKITLYVAVICSSYKVIYPLIEQLSLLNRMTIIENMKVFLFENGLSFDDKNKLINLLKKRFIMFSFLTKEMQNEWLKIDYFKNFFRNKQGFFSIAQARTILQKYVGQVMAKNENAITWVIDEDMQLTDGTINQLKILPYLKKMKIDIAIGKYVFSSPNPPINGIRTQLVDLWNNFCLLLNHKSDDIFVDYSNENQILMSLYPDYYYDLSRKHFGHLESPFWIKSFSAGETVESMLNMLCENAIKIFGGTPLTRPLVMLNTNSMINSLKDSVNRGGNTFIFNSKSLTDTPNLNLTVGESDIRRSDMVWAVINRYYRKMTIKSVDIPIWHKGKQMKDYSILDIDKLREEIVGSVLYASVTNFLKHNPYHSLNFTENDIITIIKDYQSNLEYRMILLKQNFYRARGIAKNIKNLDKINKNSHIIILVDVINKVFSESNYDILEKNIQEVKL